MEKRAPPDARFLRTMGHSRIAWGTPRQGWSLLAAALLPCALPQPFDRLSGEPAKPDQAIDIAEITSSSAIRLGGKGLTTLDLISGGRAEIMTARPATALWPPDAESPAFPAKNLDRKCRDNALNVPTGRQHRGIKSGNQPLPTGGQTLTEDIENDG